MDLSIHDILHVTVKLKRGEQIIVFTCENLSHKININFTSYSEKSNISIIEVEMLVDSKMKILYYDKGEILKNGQSCKHAKTEIKGVEIIQSDTIEKMRIKNLDKLMYFNSIRNITKGVNKNGKDYIKIQLDNLSSFFVNDIFLTEISGLNPDEFHLLIGEEVSPVFYKAHDVSETGRAVIEKDKSIIKDLNLRLYDTIENIRNFK